MGRYPCRPIRRFSGGIVKRGITRLIVAPAATAVVATAAASGGSERGPELSLRWGATTPANGRIFTVQVGTPVTIPLGAPAGVQITARGLPRGAALSRTAAGAVITWTPPAAGLGPHPVVIAARKPGTQRWTSPRTLFLYGVPAPNADPAAKPAITPLASPRVSRWAYVYHPAAVRTKPNSSGRVITRLRLDTLDGTPNLVLILAATKDSIGRTWYQVRLAIRPNNSTGWVLAGALGDQNVVKTYLVIDRQLLVATLYRSGAPVFQTRIGAGKPYWPTPTGDFYIREILTGFTDPMYGPVAFGTSDRSNALTDWHGGGGVIGIHGTDRPDILPGHVSHGCIRMPNPAARRLHRLMPLGTPVAIR